MRQSGYLLIELMIYCLVLVIVLGVLGTSFSNLNKASRSVSKYAKDLGECRRVVETLEVDLRLAEAVTGGSGHWHIRLPSSCIEYELSGGVLTRRSEAKTKTLARCIASLTLSQRGLIVSLMLKLRPRSKNAGNRGEIHTSVYLRNKEIGE